MGAAGPDWVVARDGDVWEIRLRAERAGPSTGRVYTISATATDRSRNSTLVVGTVTVPHDQRAK